MERFRFGWGKLRDLLGEANLPDLIREYWEELSPVKQAAPLDPDWPGMLALEDAGQLKIWTARAERTLVGFIGFQVFPHMHHRSTLFAFDVGHFLSPEFRDNGRLGFRMWRTAETALKAEGVKVIMAHDNADRPLLPFFLALGYEPRSTLFMKVIG